MSQEKSAVDVKLQQQQHQHHHQQQPQQHHNHLQSQQQQQQRAQKISASSNVAKADSRTDKFQKGERLNLASIILNCLTVNCN